MHTNNRSRCRCLTIPGLALGAVIATCTQAQAHAQAHAQTQAETQARTETKQDSANALSALAGLQVDVNGHRMYLDCEGAVKTEHGATVIFDAGLGDSALVWARVQPAVAGITRACSYDRAGYGESDARLPPRTSAVIVDELHALLDQAGIGPPYVLVGHSFGGWNMQLFASTYPDRVAALVLVDSSQVDQIERYYREAGVNIAPEGEFHMTRTPFVPPNLPAAQAARAKNLTYDPVTWRTAHNELAGFRRSEHQVAGARPLPAMPIVVISRGRPIATADTRAAARERLWRHLQQDFVDANPGTIHYVARHSGHYIQLQQPTLVIRSICLALHRAKMPARDCAEPATASVRHAVR